MFGKDKRRQYRVDVPSNLGFELRLKRRDSQWVRGDVVDVSAVGIGAWMNREDVKSFEIGMEFQGEIIVKKTDKPIPAHVTLRHLGSVGSDPEKADVGIEFTDPDVFIRQLDKSLLVYFNRRRAYRATTSATQTITCRLNLGRKALNCIVYDICPEGIGLTLSPDIARVLKVGKEYAMKVTLRTVGRPLELLARCVHVSEVVNKRRCGFEFTNRESPDYREAKTGINDHLMNRQREDRQRREEETE